jgi:hypothetical protein
MIRGFTQPAYDIAEQDAAAAIRCWLRLMAPDGATETEITNSVKLDDKPLGRARVRRALRYGQSRGMVACEERGPYEYRKANYWRAK